MLEKMLTGSIFCTRKKYVKIPRMWHAACRVDPGPVFGITGIPSIRGIVGIPTSKIRRSVYGRWRVALVTNKIFRSRPLYACKLSDTNNVRRDLFILRSYASLIKTFVYEDGRILNVPRMSFLKIYITALKLNIVVITERTYAQLIKLCESNDSFNNDKRLVRRSKVKTSPLFEQRPTLLKPRLTKVHTLI